MSSSGTSNSAQAPIKRRSNPYLFPLKSAIRVTLFLLSSLILSIIIEWLGIAFGWWPANHSANLVQKELSYLSPTMGFLGHSPASLAVNFADFAHNTLFESIYLDRALNALGSLFESSRAYTSAVIALTQLTAIRLAIIIFFLPLLAMILIQAVIDGLVERDLRKFGADHDSPYIYHWAKRMTSPWLILPMVVYMGMPISIHPAFIFLPSAMIAGLGLGITTSRFIKVF